VSDIASNVIRKVPETKDWLIDGPGKSQMELAKIQRILRLVSADYQETDVVSEFKLLHDLSEHPAFMLPDSPVEVQLGVLAIMRAKARASYAAESNPAVVTLWQRYGEKFVEKILHND
jgi:hypothetical protein